MFYLLVVTNNFLAALISYFGIVILLLCDWLAVNSEEYLRSL